MKRAIAITCTLLAVSSARGQFQFLSQERSAGARASLYRADYPLPGENLDLVEQVTRSASDFGPFDETVMVDIPGTPWVARATAWQQSDLSATQIIAHGGPRDVESCCDRAVDHSAGASLRA